MTRTPRAATPVPEEAGEAVDAVPVLKRIEHAKTFAGIAAALLIAGFGFAMWAMSWATKGDVEKARAAASAEIGDVRAQVLNHDRRLPVVEAAAVDLKADTVIIRAQLFEIAKAVGARQVSPAPASPTQEQP